MTTRPLSASQREAQALLPMKGLGAVTGTASVSPGTTVSLEALNIAQKKLITITPTAVNDFVYTVAIKYRGVTTTSTYTADGTATVAEITAGLEADINANQPALTVAAADGVTDFTLTPDVRGEDFSYTLSANLAAVETDPYIGSSAARVKLWVVSTGASTVYLERDGEVILPVPTLTAGFEFVAPYGSDFKVVGSTTFECYAVVGFNNTI